MASKSSNNLIHFITQIALTLDLKFLVTIFHEMYNGDIFIV